MFFVSSQTTNLQVVFWPCFSHSKRCFFFNNSCCTLRLKLFSNTQAVRKTEKNFLQQFAEFVQWKNRCGNSSLWFLHRGHIEGEMELVTNFLCIQEQFKGSKIIIQQSMFTLLGLFVFFNALYRQSLIGEEGERWEDSDFIEIYQRDPTTKFFCLCYPKLPSRKLTVASLGSLKFSHLWASDLMKCLRLIDSFWHNRPDL